MWHASDFWCHHCFIHWTLGILNDKNNNWIENQIPQLRLSIVFWGNNEMNKVSENEILLKNTYTSSQLGFNSQKQYVWKKQWFSCDFVKLSKCSVPGKNAGIFLAGSNYYSFNCNQPPNILCTTIGNKCVFKLYVILNFVMRLL